MLNVLLTVDTEFWPDRKSLTDAAVRRAVDRDIYGLTDQGELGISHQAAVLRRYGLKAVFLVESLHASILGTGQLSRMVCELQDAAQEVRLHIHPEWLRHGCRDLPAYAGSGMWYYDLEQQRQIVATAARNLRLAGAKDIRAFRAGGFRANLDTLQALADNGIAFDTSHNTAYLDDGCKMRLPETLLQPRPLGAVYEFPVTFFCDWPGHYRHLEVCACSAMEMENVLMSAWRRSWRSVVVVLHSFEMLKRRRKPGCLSGVDRNTVERFEWLCRFLAAHGDKFRTVGFGDIDVGDLREAAAGEPLRSSVFFTVARMAQQLVGRVQ